MKNKNIFLNQKVSSPLALIFLMILSFLVAWYTLAAGENILKDAKNSPAINLNVRLQQNGLKNLQ